MHVTLRDEILVVADYESAYSAMTLYGRVHVLRRGNGVHVYITHEIFAATLFQMAIEGLVEPRRLRKRDKWLVAVGPNAKYNVHDLFFRLTPLGQQKQYQLLDRLNKENANIIPECKLYKK